MIFKRFSFCVDLLPSDEAEVRVDGDPPKPEIVVRFECPHILQILVMSITNRFVIVFGRNHTNTYDNYGIENLHNIFCF